MLRFFHVQLRRIALEVASVLLITAEKRRNLQVRKQLVGLSMHLCFSNTVELVKIRHRQLKSGWEKKLKRDLSHLFFLACEPEEVFLHTKISFSNNFYFLFRAECGRYPQWPLYRGRFGRTGCHAQKTCGNSALQMLELCFFSQYKFSTINPSFIHHPTPLGGKFHFIVLPAIQAH